MKLTLDITIENNGMDSEFCIDWSVSTKDENGSSSSEKSGTTFSYEDAEIEVLECIKSLF